MTSMSDWDKNMEHLRAEAQGMHEAREEVLVQCRRLGQLAAKTIRHIHRQQYAEAESLLAESMELASAARRTLLTYSSLNPAYLHDSEKEMVEAAVVLSIVRDEPIPTADRLGAQIMSYLNGLGEAASEVRRTLLDLIRRGEMAEAERVLSIMETIYADLITFDYSDSMTNGLRRTCDALRAVVERSRSDLTLTSTQQALVLELRRMQPAP
jgi:translin